MMRPPTERKGEGSSDGCGLLPSHGDGDRIGVNYIGDVRYVIVSSSVGLAILIISTTYVFVVTVENRYFERDRPGLTMYD